MARRELFKDIQLDKPVVDGEDTRPVAVKVEDVGIRFVLGAEKLDSLKEYMIKFVTRQVKYNEFWALKNINLELKRGDRIGILGFNGAGKSTLLKIIAGVYKPTEGRVTKSGVLAPLLARENIYLYGAVLGYRKQFIEERFDDIIKFAELEKFVDVPVKNFSSGMRTRLGFSICTAVEPDILILDEVLSVGDAKFRRKSENRITDMFSNDVSVLFVSHSLDQVRRICNKAIILDHGTMLAFGDIDEVSAKYEEMVG